MYFTTIIYHFFKSFIIYCSRYSVKKWILAVFPESKDYSVIPNNWLVDKEKLAKGAIEFNRWPLTRVTSNELKSAVDP